MTEKSPQETQQENIYLLIFGSFLQKYYLKTETPNKKDNSSHCLSHTVCAHSQKTFHWGWE